MRAILPLVALLLTAPAAAEPRTPPPGDVASSPGVAAGERVCTDRIHAVRAERGLPLLDRRSASVNEPLMIAAVDQRIDGCSDLVMHYDTRDVRPLPTAERPVQLERIPSR